jgi:hypothetical protein
MYSSPADFGRFFKEQVETWGRVVRANNIQPD